MLLGMHINLNTQIYFFKDIHINIFTYIYKYIYIYIYDPGSQFATSPHGMAPKPRFCIPARKRSICSVFRMVGGPQTC